MDDIQVLTLVVTISIVVMTLVGVIIYYNSSSQNDSEDDPTETVGYTRGYRRHRKWKPWREFSEKREKKDMRDLRKGGLNKRENCRKMCRLCVSRGYDSCQNFYGCQCKKYM